MTSAQLQEALTLTVGGMGTAFATLVLLVMLVLGMKWVLGTRLVQGRTGATDAVEASAARRKKALAAAIAVSVALAEGEAADGQGTREDATA